jgi:hypothetical protein
MGQTGATGPQGLTGATRCNWATGTTRIITQWEFGWKYSLLGRC